MGELIQMFRSFCCIGVLTFGGGYSMLPMLTRETVEKHGWTTQEELLDYFAIGQCLPGLIAVNTAVFIGHKRRGVAGALACALGVVFPSVAVIILVAMLLENVMHLPLVAHAFAGVRIAVAALILSTVLKLFRSSVKNAVQIALCAAAFAAVALADLSPAYVVAGAIAVGILLRKKGEARP